MILDTLTIVVAGVVLLLAVVAPFMSPVFRLRLSDETPTMETASLPPVSVLITVHRNAPALEHYLSLCLSQQYAPGFEVIVVAEKGDTEAEDVLKRFGANKRLYTTFIPESSRYMSRKKLAITLGVKAAHNEWIVLTEADCRPTSDQWLASMVQHFDAGHNLVIGYSNYSEDACPRYRFRQLTMSAYLLRQASKGCAYRCGTSSLAFRKSEFMSGEGFRGSLEHIGGEYDFLVNKYARRGATAVELSPEAFVEEDAPSARSWRNLRLFTFHTNRYLKRGWGIRVLTFLDALLLHLSFLGALVSAVWGGFSSRWIVLGAGVLALIVSYVERMLLVRRKLQVLVPRVPLWKVPFYELLQMWSTVGLRLRYLFTDKYTFTCHKQ